MGWEIAGAQSLGGRDNQEDGLVILGETGAKPVLLAVADGAGGHADGEKASKTALDRLRQAFVQMPQNLAAARDWMRQAIIAADRDVAALGGARTTVVIVWLGAGKGLVGHVGDSRLYHFRSGKLGFRTRDHSVVQLLLDMARLQESEIADHPDRSRLTKALGSGDIDAPEMAEFDLAAGDGLVLCSDGVWEPLAADELEIALRAPALDREAERLVRQAVQRGGSDADNATIILARLR